MLLCFRSLCLLTIGVNHGLCRSHTGYLGKFLLRKLGQSRRSIATFASFVMRRSWRFIVHAVWVL